MNSYEELVEYNLTRPLGTYIDISAEKANFEQLFLALRTFAYQDRIKIGFLSVIY
jgi:hypothetical protein